jgi:hypothetical protein
VWFAAGVACLSVFKLSCSESDAASNSCTMKPLNGVASTIVALHYTTLQPTAGAAYMMELCMPFLTGFPRVCSAGCDPLLNMLSSGLVHLLVHPLMQLCMLLCKRPFSNQQVPLQSTSDRAVCDDSVHVIGCLLLPGGIHC